MAHLLHEPVRRDRDRRRPQRAGRCGLPCEGGRADAGARGPAQDRRRRGHHGAVAGGARVQGHHAQLRDEPDARHHPSRPAVGTARLPRASDRPVFPAVPRRALHRAVRRLREELRRVRQVLEARRGRDRGLGRVDRGTGRGARSAPHDHAADRRIEATRRPRRSAPARLAVPRSRREDGRRRDAPDDHVDRRHPGSVLRVGSGEDRDVAERPDRHVGGAVRAGDRLRDGAPLDRRRRRRQPGRVGGAGGRDGRGGGGDRGQRADVRRRDQDERARRSDPDDGRRGRAA